MNCPNPAWATNGYRLNSTSKVVLPTVKLGPPARTEARTRRFRGLRGGTSGVRLASAVETVQRTSGVGPYWPPDKVNVLAAV